MSISFQRSVGLYESALKLRAEKAEVISSNLANADTPEYKARDFDFQKALAARMDNYKQDNALYKSRGSAAQGVGPAEKAFIDLQYRTPTQPSIDGNTVEEHLEHAEFMKNNLEFQTAFTLLNSRFKGLISAIKGE